MADPEAPEMPEGWREHNGVFINLRPGGYRIGLTVIRALLATRGLYIVSEADRKVLDCIAKADISVNADSTYAEMTYEDETRVCLAELARRTT